MARLIVEIDGNASKLIAELKKGGASVKEFKGETDGASKGAAGLSGSLKDLAASYGPALGIAAVTTAVAAYGKEAFISAGQSKRVEESNDSLAKNFGTTTDAIVGAMKKASKGTISEFDAMRFANDHLLAGTIKTPQRFAELTEAAEKLARAKGISLVAAMERLTGGIVKGETELLDELGIIVSVEDAYKKYAESVGKSTQELTKEEKARAAANMIIDTAIEKAGLLGEAQEDNITKLERASAQWEDLQVKSGEALNVLVEVTGVLDGVNTVLDYMISNVTAAGEAFDQGLAAGFLQVFDNANPVLQLLEGFGVDVIPDFVAASEEAVGALETQSKAHEDTKTAIEDQAGALNDLKLTQAEYFGEAGDLEEEFNEKKQDLLNERLEALEKESQDTSKNTQDLNQKLLDLQTEANEKKADLQKKAKDMTASELQAEMAEVEGKYQRERQSTIDHYTELNATVADKTQERLEELRKAQEEEEKQYNEHMQKLILKTVLSMAEANGELEALTGGVATTAEDAMALIEAGIIPVTAKMQKELKEGYTQLTRGSDNFRATEERNQGILQSLFGRTAAAQSSIGSTRKGPGFSRGGKFTVPEGFPNDSYPIWVESGEEVSIIPRSQAARTPKFAKGTGIPPGFKPDGKGDFVHNSYQPGYVWNGSKYVPPMGTPNFYTDRDDGIQKVGGFGWDAKNRQVISGTSSDSVTLAQYNASSFARGGYTLGNKSKPSGKTFARYDAQKRTEQLARDALAFLNTPGAMGGTVGAASAASMPQSSEVDSLLQSSSQGVTKTSAGNVTNLYYSPTYYGVSSSDPSRDYQLMKSLV